MKTLRCCRVDFLDKTWTGLYIAVWLVCDEWDRSRRYKVTKQWVSNKSTWSTFDGHCVIDCYPSHLWIGLPPWVLIILIKWTCCVCPCSSYSNSFYNISCLSVFILMPFTTSHVCLCLPYLNLQHPVSPHVHPTYFYNIQCLPVFIRIDFTKSHVCPCSSCLCYVRVLIIFYPFIKLIENKFLA